MPRGDVMPVLPALSGSYPGLRGTLAIHYSPVRHWMALAGHPVRLACLSHAASVQAEPGSNSSIEFLGPATILTPGVQGRTQGSPLQRPGLTLSRAGLSSKRVCPTHAAQDFAAWLLLPPNRLGDGGQ